MKTKLTKRFSKLIAILAFLALLAGNAFAIENKTSVVSPYWQSDGLSYTFIAVSHTSLSGMASQIDLTISAITDDNGIFGAPLALTVASGTTTRVFIVRTNHGINPASISGEAMFIVGSSEFAHGHVLIASASATPAALSNGFNDSTMLSYWGAVVIEQNTTGFAMEFIGDMNDSQATTNVLTVAGPAAP